MEDYLKHAIELVKAQASVRVMSEDEMAEMISSLSSKLKKLDCCEEVEEACPSAEAPVVDPKRSIKEKSIVCLAHSYLTDTSETVSRQTGVAKYALGEDYHTVLKDKMHRLCAELKKTAGEFSYRVFTDSAPVAERRLAQRAGLGWIGKSTQLILPGVGSYVLLSEIVTDLALPPDEPFPGSRCGACRRCQMACPTGALDGQGTLDARKCLSYATIESRDDLPEDLSEKLGGRVFGCDACLDACPWNRHAGRTGEPRLQPLSALTPLQKSQWLTLDKETFDRTFALSPLQRAGWEKIRRTAEKALKK